MVKWKERGRERTCYDFRHFQGECDRSFNCSQAGWFTDLSCTCDVPNTKQVGTNYWQTLMVIIPEIRQFHPARAELTNYWQ